MRGSRWRSCAWVLALSLFPCTSGADSPAAALLDVPYLAQSEALCGGAAAAMVQRFWGARGVQSEDFAPLLDARGDGIETRVLTDALTTAGWRAHVIGSTASVRHHLSRGRPVIALIAVAPRRYHYVVIVAFDDRHVTYHDPALRPGIVSTRDVFERAWASSSNWALLILPGERTTVTSAAPLPAPPPAACADALAQAATASGERQFEAAESFLTASRLACPGSAAPLRELAALRLLQRRVPEAVDAGREAVGLDSTDVHAWRVLGTALFLARDSSGALDAWNRAGEPVTDLIRVDGLSRTRHRVVTDRMGLEPGAMLTPASLSRARRRLAALPAIAASRVDAVPVGGGLSEVEASVIDRPLMPWAPLSLAGRGARAAITRDLTWQISSPTGSGERLDFGGRWWPERPAIGAALSVPSPWSRIGGSVRLSAEWSRESYASMDAVTREDARTAIIGLSDWTARGLRWESRLRADRWSGRRLLAGVGGSLEQRLFADRGALRASADVWPAGEVTAATIGARWRASTDGATQLLAAVNFGATTDSAPRALWSGAGIGLGRPWLLRAHPMLDDGVTVEGSIGRRVAQASVEGRRRVARLGLLRLDAAAFVDAAFVNATDAAATRQIDAGVGVRVRIPGEGTVRVDVARGLRDDAHALSVGWELPWPAWP